MVGCQNKAAMAELEEFKAQAELEQKNIEIVKKIFEEIDKKNFDVYDELHSEDFIFHMPPYPDSKLEAHKQAVQEAYIVRPDYTHTIEDIVVEGDKIAVRLTNRWTDKASDKKIEIVVIMIVKIAQGRVVETWAISDNLGLAQQLGMELIPKEKK